MDPTTLPLPGGSSGRRRVGFLGPEGTFTEEALLSQADLAADDLVGLRSWTEVLAAVKGGDVDLGFVAVENSIEGTVNQVIDALVFETDLWIQREVVHEIAQNLLAPPGTRLEDVRRLVSFPNALGQCRQWAGANLPGVEEVAANSTSEAARLVAEGVTGAGAAALGTALAAKLYGLEVLVPHVEDHPGNMTRFLVVAAPGPGRIPPISGHDKTSIVCFQKADVPGSLHAILGQFSARGINLTKLESRPTKRGLGDYCFVIDFEGHVDDEVVADCLRDLHASLASLKFMGSYPAAGEHGPGIRRDAEAAWRAADGWIGDIRSNIAGN
ncbi:MAG TPA: prephenate dehydratase [Acidimicrobiales bacterium]|jgi:prephenate dehydratase